jgi:hypothetical protein
MSKECFEIGAGNCKGVEDTMLAGIVEQAEFCRASLSTHHVIKDQYY